SETETGIAKGVRYAKDLGADSDYTREHSAVIFPFFTQTGKTGAPRSEYQIRVPVDDTHTYHICYQVYAAPPGVEAPKQDSVPWYEPPRFDENGKPILDYVLAQDALVWDAQGPITDRSTELLGRTDIPIVLLRRQLDAQIGRVEEGLEPINFYRESPEIIYGSGSAPDYSQPLLKHNFRKMYHRGFFNDDADRYGPALELVKDLHRRIEEFETARAEASEGADANAG
ncbi:MAG: 5,5-dehydrodivanillate O-demethylase oxygenase subunit, partial [Paraburkholderia sp.]|nr:5,5-dehydrodivanillate O-demethylase oxygenase subunit [Paraburkholderia sp.]